MDKTRTEKIEAECPNCRTLFETHVTKAQFAAFQKTRSAGPYPVHCVIHAPTVGDRLDFDRNEREEGDR